MKKNIAAILLLIGIATALVWMAMHVSFKEVTVHAALRGEALRNPFYAAIRFSEALGAEAEWERVFTAPAPDSVIMLSTWNWTLSRARREHIQRWVESGGRLVVDASLLGDSDVFAGWSGIDVVSRDEEPADEEETASAPLEAFLSPKCHTLTGTDARAEFKVCGIDTSRSLSSLRKPEWVLRDGERIHVLRTRVGRGSVTVINATPFGRREFFLGDHPRLFVFATQLHRGDSLRLFTEEDHASLLTLVWRFGAPVVLLMLGAIALSLWRVSARFGPKAAATETARRSLAEQIRGTGLFTLRFGGGRSLHAAQLRALRDAAVRRVPGFDQLTSEERVIALSTLGAVPAAELGPAMNFTGARSSHELRNAIAILETARRRILTKDKRERHGN